MVDTHCHLNFKTFDGRVEDVIKRAKEVGVERFIVPGTDIESSKKAVELAEKYNEVYAAVGIHPHHAREINIQYAVSSIQELLSNKKVVAVGEVGMDKHVYKKTKYDNYQIDPEFVQAQKQLFIEQIKLAVKYKKSLIIHNRQAGELLAIIGESSVAKALTGRAVFHCCEANDQLLQFALAHQIYIGVDGDVTYSSSKIEFVKKIPLELLVLETDSPFLIPEPLRSRSGSKSLVNEPKNLQLIAQQISEMKNTPIKRLIEVTQRNSLTLFNIE